MKRWFFTFLIAVTFVACGGDTGTKVDTFNLDSFVRAEGIVTRDAIQSIIIEVRFSDDPDAVCDAVQKEIDKFKKKIRPYFGDRLPSRHIPPATAEDAVRREAYREYSEFLSSFDDAEGRCRNIANNRKLEESD
jgi:hypothetical protein